MKKEAFYIFFALSCWGTSATISKLCFNGLDPAFTLAGSFTAASIVLFVQAVVSGGLKELKTAGGKELLRMSSIGLIGTFFYNYFLQLGIAALPAQMAFVVHYSWPVFVILFSVPILRERLTPGKMVAILLSFAGVAIVGTNGSLEGIRDGQMQGILMCLIAALLYGLYTPLNKKQSYDKALALFPAYVCSAAAAWVYALVKGTVQQPTNTQLIGFVLYGVFVNALGYMFWNLALQTGNTAVMSNLSYLSPVISLAATHFVLGEEITVYSVLGLALILSGVFIQSYLEWRRAAHPGIKNA